VLFDCSPNFSVLNLSTLHPKAAVKSIHDWRKESQLRVLDKKKEERGIKVKRSGVKCVIDVKELLVGDIAFLEPGEIIPCDGVFISGHGVMCDESGVASETDDIKKNIKKLNYDGCNTLRGKAERGGSDVPDPHTDCFIISGSKVITGNGRYVVIAVGQNSFNGRRAVRGTFFSQPFPFPTPKPD